MTKAKAARAQLPGQPSDAEPVQTTPTDEVLNPVHDEAGAPPQGPAPDTEPAPPPAEPQPPAPRLPPVLCSITRLAIAQSLPEVVGEVETQPIEFAPGSIERFKASDTDRRTM